MSVVILIALIAAVVAVPLVFLARRRPGGGGTSSPTEFLVYLILAGATLIATGAFSSLVELVLPGRMVLSVKPDQLALSISTLLVAGIVAVVVWLTLERAAVVGNRPARALYTSVVTGFAMVVTAVALVHLGLWITGQEPFVPGAVSNLVAFAGIWILHEQVRQRGVELDELRDLVGTVAGLILAVGGFGMVLGTSLEAAFRSGTVIGGAGGTWEGVAAGLVLLVVGTPYFWWFWLRQLSRRMSWTRIYATVTALISWVTSVTSGAAMTYSLLAVLFGFERARLGEDFPSQLTVTIVGGLVYWHHRGVLGRERSLPVLIIEYAFAAFGFIAGAGALVTLAATVIENLTGQAVVGSNNRVLLGSGVALVFAAAVLARYWLTAQRRAQEAAEQQAIPRRVAITGLLTGFILAGLGALIAILFVLLRSALGGTGDDADVLSWAVPLVVAAGGLAWYFAGIRPRRAPSAEAAPTRLGVSTVTVVATDPGPLPSMIEGMRFLHRNDGLGVVDEAQAAAITSALSNLEGGAALVVVNQDSFQAIPLS